MQKSWWWKLALLAVVFVWAVMYVIPTVGNLDPATSKFPVKQKINLGLDLQGGLYMVLGVDFNKVYQDLLVRQQSSFQARLKDKGIELKSAQPVRDGVPADDPRFQIEFDSSKREEIYQLIKTDYQYSLRLVEESAGKMQLGMAREYRTEIRDRTIGQSIEVIRNRIDEFGVAEPSIASQGSDRIVVELPGVKEVERAKDLIGRTAKLEFKIVDDKSMDPGQLAALVGDLEKNNDAAFKEGQKFSEYAAKINELAKGKLPAGKSIIFERPRGQGVDPLARIPYLVGTQADMSGEDLQDAQVTMNQEDQRPVVAFQFNPRGGAISEKVTGDNVGNRMAIVLDNIVQSAPVIQSRIGDRGQITLGTGNYDQILKEAQDLAIVLRAGALPAQLDFLEQRVIGPSLGQDSIRNGVKAGLIGCSLVFIFMIIYYKMSGVVAVISLLLNGLFVLAILVGMDATLTLPGIAGLALTIGMAVDSNVIIFERIRDELEEGKGAVAAIEAGFDKAFRSIFDANITHGIVAVILLNFGTGPIKGFAVTLLIGMVTTLFTAVTVCKLVFDGYIGRSKGNIKELSI